MIKLFADQPDVNCAALQMQDLAGREDRAVVRDENGVPAAWRLFAYGPFSITRDGKTLSGEFTPEAADAIMAHHRQKGGKIPLDSRHFLFRLAEHFGVSEQQVASLLPDGRGTFGYAALEAREDGLWLTDVEYVPLAYSLMAEGVFRYFSPVIRGLADGRLRITSVAFTNEPAIDRLESLAADTGEEPVFGSVDALAASLDAVAASATAAAHKGKKEPVMEKLLVALASLLGMDSIALSDDNTVPEDVVSKINDLAGEVDTLRAGREAQRSFIATAAEALALGDDPDLNKIEAAIRGMKAKAGQADELKSRLDALELEAETRRRAEVVQRGLEEGKLTKALIESEWGKAQDAAALEAYIANAPVLVPGDRVNTKKLRQPDTVTLSDDDRTILSLVGVTDPAAQEQAAKE